MLWYVTFICTFETGWDTFENIYRHSSGGKIMATSNPSLDLVHVLLQHKYACVIPIPNVNDNAGETRRKYADIAICDIKELNE